MLTKTTRILSLCLLLMIMMTSAASAAPMTTTNTMPQAQTTGSYGTNEVFAGTSPTTGLQTGSELYRPLMVQISNSAEARPHWNLSEADIVYEMIYWGPAHTRYSAIYNDNHPELVGSVRSARLANCEIRQEWDCPFVFFGGQDMPGTSIYDFFSENNVPKAFRFDGTGNGKAFTRVSERQSPHNAVSNLSEIVNNYWPTNEDGSPYQPKSHAFRFSSQPSTGTDTAVEIDVIYDANAYHPSYTYNAAERVYERWYNGQEQYDGKTNKRIVASNVIVQFCDLSYYNSSRQRPVITTVGTGTMDAFIDGQHIRGKWVRNTMSDRTIFTDMNGEEITMLPGKTFIQMIPSSSEFSYLRADGTEMTVDSGTEVLPPMFDPNETEADIDNMEGAGN